MKNIKNKSVRKSKKKYKSSIYTFEGFTYFTTKDGLSYKKPSDSMDSKAIKISAVGECRIFSKYVNSL